MSRPASRKFSSAEAEEIRLQRSQGSSFQTLKDRWNCGMSTVKKICNGKTYAVATNQEKEQEQ